MTSPIRKAVFPAAGLGTRFLPATKAMPKEMLTLIDRPIIQYGVEEAVASGITDIVLVTGRGKNAIEDHFDVSSELEAFLAAKGKHEMLEEVKKVSSLINLSYVRQGEPLGLGHAVLVTKNLIGDEPFAVVLGDDIFDAKPPALRQMLTVFDKVQSPVIAVERVPQAEVSSYGILAVEPAPEIGLRRAPHPRHGREAAARRGAVEPGHHRPLPADARHLSGPRSHGLGSHRRDPAHQRLEAPARHAQALCARGGRRAPRRRQQDWAS